MKGLPSVGGGSQPVRRYMKGGDQGSYKRKTEPKCIRVNNQLKGECNDSASTSTTDGNRTG